MSKTKKTKLSQKESRIKKRILIVLLVVFILIGLYFYNKDKEQLAFGSTIYYTGDVYSANHAANMIDYLDKGDNIVLSPINVNTSLAILYNGTDNNSNKELKKYFKKSTSKLNEEMNIKLGTIKEKEYQKNQFNKLYESYIKELYDKSYNKLTKETIELLNFEEQEEIVLLAKKIELSYERLLGNHELTENRIKNYTLTNNDLTFNNYTIKKQIDNVISDYELYSIDNTVKNNTEIFVKNLNTQNINEDFATNTSFYNYQVKEIVAEENVSTPRIVQEENKSVVINNNLEFNYSWDIAFDHNNIKDAEFFTSNGEVHAVEMMYSIETTYLENSKAKGFKYDFKNSKYSYVGILPKTNGAFKLSELDLDSLLLSKKEDKVLIGLPKMDYNSEVDIKELASHYNIQEIFTNQANFTRITDDNLIIDKMIQKNNLTIAEKGTVKSSLKQTETHRITEEYNQQIILNRPFAYLIINNETNDIMFIGKVVRVNESS